MMSSDRVRYRRQLQAALLINRVFFGVLALVTGIAATHYHVVVFGFAEADTPPVAVVCLIWVGTVILLDTAAALIGNHLTTTATVCAFANRWRFTVIFPAVFAYLMIAKAALSAADYYPVTLALVYALYGVAIATVEGIINNEKERYRSPCR